MEYKERKRTRLPDYNYSTPGAYFVTICTKEHREILSKITVGDGVDRSTDSLPDSVGAIHESPVNKLSAYGEIVKVFIEKLPARFPIEIDNYVIMPNHIHLLIRVDTDGANGRAIRESPLRRERSIISKVVGYLKMNASKMIHGISKDMHIWQRDYNDHIIRGREDYENIWNYIDTNVIRWVNDKYYKG